MKLGNVLIVWQTPLYSLDEAERYKDHSFGVRQS